MSWHALTVAMLSAAAAGQDSNIQYIVLIKDNNVQQNADGSHEVLQWEFFSEVFLFKNATIPQPMLRGPGAATVGIPFEHTGHESNHTTQNTSWEWQAWAPFFDSEEQVDAAYPDGTYTVELDSPPRTGLRFNLQEKRELTKDGLGVPAPINVSFSQAGADVAAHAVDPTLDLHVRWSPFTAGGPDPLGICDDLVYFKIKHANGTVILRTAGPFGSCSGEACEPMLTFRNESYAVASRLLPRGGELLVTVEHAKLITSRQHGIPTLATFGTTSYVPVSTLAAPSDAVHV